MSITRKTGFAGLFGAFGNAVAAAAAVNTGRQPKARDLRGLGIDPRQFGEIRRF